MVDVDTFLTTLYVMAEGFGKTSLPPPSHPQAPRPPEPERGRHHGPVRVGASVWQSRPISA